MFVFAEGEMQIREYIKVFVGQKQQERKYDKLRNNNISLGNKPPESNRAVRFKI